MRIIVLIISVALVGFLFYQYMNQNVWKDTSLGVPENTTPIGTVDYAREATRKFELDNCLRLCNPGYTNDVEDCQLECQEDYGQ